MDSTKSSGRDLGNGLRPLLADTKTLYDATFDPKFFNDVALCVRMFLVVVTEQVSIALGFSMPVSGLWKVPLQDLPVNTCSTLEGCSGASEALFQL